MAQSSTALPREFRARATAALRRIATDIAADPGVPTTVADIQVGVAGYEAVSFDLSMSAGTSCVAQLYWWKSSAEAWARDNDFGSQAIVAADGLHSFAMLCQGEAAMIRFSTFAGGGAKADAWCSEVEA